MQLQFLGTGAGMPSKMRNTSSLLLNLREEGEGYWLFDCGEATQHQILQTTIKPRLINKIFITHLHGDHIFGLPGLLSSRSFQGGEEKLKIFGPLGLEKWVKDTLVLTNTYLPYEIEFYTIQNDGLLLDLEEFQVHVKQLAHVIPSFGFRIEQKNQPGKLLIDKALAKGVPKGPLLGKLKKGIDICLHDGTIITSEEVTGEQQKGFTLAILGDTKYCQASIALAKNANLVIHEATFNNETEHLAAQYGHSTIQEAAKVAKKANAHALIVNHISARFLPNMLKEFREEGQSIFANTFIAEDFSTFQLQNEALVQLDDS